MQVNLNTTQPYELYPATGKVALIVNKDSSNAILLGPEQGALISASPDCTVLDPLAAMIVTGMEPVWGIALSGTPLVSIAPNVINWTPALAQLAPLFSAIGIPPIDNPQLLGVQFNSPVAAGATVNLSGHISVGKYQSFHAKLQAAPSAASTNPYIQATFNWSMVVDNFDPTYIENWTYQSGPSGLNPFSVLGHGPVIGDTLDLIFTNYDSVSQNITWAIFGSYRTRTRTLFRGGAASGGTDALGLGTDDILVSANGGALGAIATGPPFQMQLFDGPVSVSASVVFAAAPANSNWAVYIRPQPNSVLGNVFYVPGQDIPQLGGATPTRTIPPTEVILPRRPCTIGLVNDTNTAINSYQIVVTAQEQPW